MRSVIVRLDPPGGEMVSDAAQNGGLCPLLRRPLCPDGGGCRAARALPAQYHENGLPLPEGNDVGRSKKFCLFLKKLENKACNLRRDMLSYLG